MKTHLEYFYHWEKNAPNREFLKQPFSELWRTLTYSQAGEQARKLVTVLKDFGLKKGDHVGILSKNCYHWILADLAISMGGFISVPFYASLPKKQLNEVVLKSNIKLLFVGKLDSWDDKSNALPQTLKVIKFPHYNGNAPIPIGDPWDELIKNKTPYNQDHLPSLNDIWTIVYTSGTTGSPKGVILPFKSIAILFKNEETFNTLGIHYLKKHSFFSFLPLNHLAERLIIEGGAFFTGGSIAFAQSIDTFMKNLQDIQPTVFFAVPRLWRKFQSGILLKISQNKLNVLLKAPLVCSIVKKKIKKSLGLSNAEIILTGAALTPKHIKQWYRKLDINLREVFGSSEACGGVTITPIGEVSDIGVGKPIEGVEFKIDSKTGEIIYKCEQLMTGYYNDLERTLKVLKDGWYHSGDKGFLDKNNNLHVIGRIKDEFKTEKGIYITPNPIEDMISKNELIEQVCVVGLTSPQPLALINLSDLAHDISNENIQNNLAELLITVNQDLANHSKISSFVITKETWNEKNNMLTPTLKVKRNIIDENYMSKYIYWYNLADKVIWDKS